MTLFEQLSAAIDEEHRNGELPDNLVEPLKQVCANPHRFADQRETVERLLYQLQRFEPYCDCGCFAEGFNAAAIIKTLSTLGIQATE